MASLRRLTAEDVLEGAAAKLRLWQSAEASDAPLEAPVREHAGRSLAALAPLLVFLSRSARWRAWPAAARWLAERARAANPQSATALLALALALRRSGRDADALLPLLSASQLEDGRKQGSWELARLLLWLEREDAPSAVLARYRNRLISALRTAASSSDRTIRAEASILLSNLLHEFGESGEARAAAETALSVAPNDSRALRAKANALTAEGEFQQARTLYDRLLALEPRNPELARRAEVLSSLPPNTRKAAADILGTERQPASILVAVGGGIGDMLHVGPMIRNLARRTERPVDVLVMADHPEAGFLYRECGYVSRVWSLCTEVLERRYKTAFLSYSFGPWRLPFNAEQVLISRLWRRFRPGHLNETVFNLEAAKALLGIPYDRQDATQYFAGELAWVRPPRPLVGLHAGSKGGRWLSKRWPHFPELAARLKARGVAVASFGTADEYVDGSEDRTGGSIEEMSRSMLDCSLFVSNDSGPMHIASAMGMPVLALYAPTDPFTHLPLARNVTALALEKSCAPCEVKDHRYFASGACRCVGEIAVRSVEEMTMELLRAGVTEAGVVAGARE